MAAVGAAAHEANRIGDESDSLRTLLCRSTSSSASSATQPWYDQHLLQGIDTEEIIATVYARRAPMMSAAAGLQL